MNNTIESSISSNRDRRADDDRARNRGESSRTGSENDSLRGTQAQLALQQEVQLVHCTGDATYAGAVRFVR